MLEEVQTRKHDSGDCLHYIGKPGKKLTNNRPTNVQSDLLTSLVLYVYKTTVGDLTQILTHAYKGVWPCWATE